MRHVHHAKIRAASLIAAALVVCAALLAAGLLRYPLRWPEQTVPDVVVSEIARPQSARASRAPPVQRQREPSPETAPVQAPAPMEDQPAPSAAPVTISSPVWVNRPRHPERFYPREAFMQGVEGEVVLDCMVSVEGNLNCAVIAETPEGRGFGEAALAIAEAHVMRPAQVDGNPVRGRYRMRIPFTAGG